jgi:HJR/Mrr/RecB family endonuclease
MWRMSQAQPTAHVRDTVNAHKILVEKLEWKKRVARLRYTLYDNIKMGT